MKTYKQRFNEELGFDKDQEHSLQELKGITGTVDDLARKWTLFKGLGVRFRNLFWS